MHSYSYQDFVSDSECLFEHFLDLKRFVAPNELLDHIYGLFIDSSDYFDPEILAALHRIVLSKWADQEFTNILNRCCYILINHWWLQSEARESTAQLVTLFQQPAPPTFQSQATQRLQELVHSFTESQQYSMLLRRAQVTETKPLHDRVDRIGSLIHRYPHLYSHCLMDWDSSEAGRRAVKQLQVQKEKQFEHDLMRFLTDSMLRSTSLRAKGLPGATNPTLLSAEQLETAVQKFAGKAEGNQSYDDASRHLLNAVSRSQSYQAMKGQLYEYLVVAINSSSKSYGGHHFNRWLEQRLKEMMPQSDQLKPNGFLLVQTCGQLIETLVASPTQLNHHLRFVDLINNLGATFTIGLLLKIVLLCRSLKSNLDAIKARLAQRFAMMFKHYEHYAQTGNEWLLECLDNLTVALSIHFGHEDYAKWANLAQSVQKGAVA
jgi:hypothetical protein